MFGLFKSNNTRNGDYPSDAQYDLIEDLHDEIKFSIELLTNSRQGDPEELTALSNISKRVEADVDYFYKVESKKGASILIDYLMHIKKELKKV